MGQVSAIVLCLAYILGLLLTQTAGGGFAVLGLGVILAIGIPRRWRSAPGFKLWLAAGVVGLLATLYFQARIPQPGSNDISKRAIDSSQETAVVGVINSPPRQTRGQKAQFWLDVQQVEQEQATGALYVTVPLLQSTGLHPGQTLKVRGTLYTPKPATNPGGFDFQAFLAREGSFAGLRGRRADVLKSSPNWGGWIVQEQIARSQMLWLDSPAGQVVSAMVLGSKGVDLPSDVKDQFTRAGLSHALAASGFQTSLILGVVLALTRRLSPRIQFAIGTVCLAGFVFLTGLQPSVLRAALMGFGGLVALVLKRKVKPLTSLLVAAVLLLLFNPLWIWNLGFQLSFLATMGLLVTVPPVTKRLDWMPSAIAPLVAVPIAAYLWTLPLQLYAFGILSPYTIPVNVLVTPLISILSLGGMASALAALVWSPAGSALAWLLKYPTLALLTIVDTATQLPGNGYAVGTLPAAISIGLYALIGLVWLQPWWQRRGWVALLLGASLVFIPAWQAKANQFRISVLSTSAQPVLAIEDGGHTALVNAGDAATTQFTLLPFLQKAGVNEINSALSTEPLSPSQGWNRLRDRLPIKNSYFIAPEIAAPTLPNQAVSVVPGSAIRLGSTQVKIISATPPIVEFQIHHQTWLWVSPLTPDQQTQLLKSGDLHPVQVLWWSGKRLKREFLEALHPQVAIASASTVNSEAIDLLRDLKTRLYWTGRDGAIQWTAQDGFKTTLEAGDNSPSAL